jgi:hypothetical protein
MEATTVLVVTERDIIKSVLDRWCEQHRGYHDNAPIGNPGRYHTVAAIRAGLQALDLQTCSVAEVDAVIGVEGWAENKCDECGRHRLKLIRFGDEPDYDARWQDLCGDCLSDAIAELSK